jgi:hypothetical protein
LRGREDDESLEFGGMWKSYPLYCAERLENWKIGCGFASAPFYGFSSCRFCYLPTYIPTTLYIRMENGELEMIGYSGQTFWMSFLVAIYSGLCRPLLLVIWPLIRFELRRLNIMMAVFFQIHFGKRYFTSFLQVPSLTPLSRRQ